MSGEDKQGPGGEAGHAAAAVDLLTCLLHDREAIAVALVTRLPYGLARHRADAALGEVSAARLGLTAAINGPGCTVGGVLAAGRDVARALAGAEDAVWKAFGGLARTAALSRKAVVA